jgi:ATP-dependent DNA ligase
MPRPAAGTVFVAEITYLTWTADNLLRHTVYGGLRADKPAEEVRREAGTRWDAK